ncbi:MAG: sigma-70 family RNA polymerase sigma factor [Fimbriimonadales bacterium]
MSDHGPDAFGLLIDRYAARVFGFVSRTVRDRDDAEDIAQEVFVRAFQSPGRFDDRASYLTWLFKIATNLSVDRARKMGRGPAFVSFGNDADSHRASAISDVHADPESRAIVGEMESAIKAAISGLSDKLRTTLLLHDLERQSYEEIAEIREVPVGTV